MIYFARHGQTLYNKEERFQGVSDSSLTVIGIEQAKKLKDFLIKNKVTEGIVSPLLRVVKTAEIINIPFKIDERLHEICYGEWEGKTKAELKNLSLWKEREKDRFGFKHPGEFNGIKGESYEDLYKRLKSFLEDLNGREANSNLVVLSHLGIFRCVCKYFNNLSDIEAGRLEFKNDSVLVLKNGKVFEYKRPL